MKCTSNIGTGFRFFMLLSFQWFFINLWRYERNDNKKHSENADTSTSVTFDPELWRSKRLMSLVVAYCIVPCMVQVWCLRVCAYNTRYDHKFLFCYLWTSPVIFIVRQGHFHFYYWMNVMLLCIGTKYEVCRFNRIWDMDNCLEKT